VVLSDIAPHRELAGGSDDIPLVSPGDTAGFAREIARLTAMTPDQRSALGARCREVVQRRYSLALMHDAYVGVYAEAAAGAPA
jgi:glycosyltransferase involved in cell wall biosynthesis